MSAIANAMKASKSRPKLIKPRQSIKKQTFMISPGTEIPPSLLDVLGAARYDPFDTFCVKNISRKTHRVLDLAISTQWSIYAKTQKEVDQVCVKREVMGYAVHSELPYYTTMFAAFCHYAFFLENSDEQRESETIRLWLKQQIIHKLMTAIKESNGKATDEILMGIIFIGCHGGGETLKRQPLSTIHQRKSAKKFQNLEYWCTLYTIDEHLETFYRLVADKGGIYKAFNPTLRTAALMCDIFNAWRDLRKPKFPLAAPISYLIAMRRWKSDDEAVRARTTLTQGLQSVFSAMPQDPATNKLHEVVDALKVLMLDYEQVDRCKNAIPELRPDQTLLLWLRGSILWELMSLPDQRAGVQDSGVLLYETCRLSCLMFVQIETFPMLGSKPNMPRRLIKMLSPILNYACGKPGRLPDVSMWFVVSALMLAYEDFDMSGELESLDDINESVQKAISQYNDWEDVSQIMMKFIWRRPDCDWTGKDAWNWAKKHIAIIKRSDSEDRWDNDTLKDSSTVLTPGLSDFGEATESWLKETKAFTAENELWRWVQLHSP